MQRVLGMNVEGYMGMSQIRDIIKLGGSNERDYGIGGLCGDPLFMENTMQELL